VEAVICLLRAAVNSPGDARATGSSWIQIDFPNQLSFKLDTIISVDKNNGIEVYEGDSAAKTPVQNSFVYFVGYILKGGFDDGSGTAYQYKAIPSPTDDGVGTGAWENFNITGKTSATVTNVYQRIRLQSASARLIYARNIGSTDAVVQQAAANHYIASFPLNVDANGDVENYLQTTESRRYIFGYIDRYIRHSPRSTVISQ
jgi:hypothetical protein